MAENKPTYNPIAVNSMIAALNKYGLTNPNVQTGILGTVGKETGFKLRPEEGYGKTKNERIRYIFGSRVADLTDPQLEALKKDNVAFFEKVYGYKTTIGKQLGNTQPGDGYKFRGRAFNGITGRAQYKLYGDKMGVDLVSNPDRLNEIPLAAEVTAIYYRDNYASAEKRGDIKKAIGVDKANDCKTVKDGIEIAIRSTGGWWGKSLTEGFRLDNLQKATASANTILQEAAQYALAKVSDNPGKSIIGLLFFLAATVTIVVKRKEIKSFINKNLFKR